MRICIYGAGALGGVLGAYLARAGRAVSLVARGRQLDAIRADGLTLRGPGGTFSVQIPCSDDPADLGAQDLVICATKSYSLPQVAEAIAPLLGPDTPVIFVVNGIPWWYFHGLDGPDVHLEGVDPGRTIWNHIGPERAIGSVAYTGASAPAPGIVEHNSGGRFVLGEPAGAISPRLSAVAQALSVDGLEIVLADRIREEILSKLMGNVAFNSLGALTRSSVGTMLDHPDVRILARRLMEQCMAVGMAMGCTADIDIDAKLTRYSGLDTIRPSTLQDLEAGRPLEIDAIAGAVSQLGRIYGVATPDIDAVYGMLKLLATSLGLTPVARAASPGCVT